jgi:hypothetical protein
MLYIFGTFHKTGTNFWKNILIKYFNDNKIPLLITHYLKDLEDLESHNDTYIFVENSGNINFNLLKNCKIILFIRNPKEIIMSSVRYHQLCNEEWCTSKNIYKSKETDKYDSYQNIIRKLDIDDKIIFEMNNASKFSINKIIESLKFNNIVYIKLEDLINESLILDISNNISNFFNLNSIKLHNIILSNSKKKSNCTKIDNTPSYLKYFKENHLILFYNLYNKSLLQKLYD